MDASQIIAALGNTVAVANELGAKQTAVSNWKKRGIPWRWRQKIKMLARRKRVSLPADFMGAE